ncbi:hypothetical protein D3H35_01770 [Cohnella faecalis]|uniref:Uncharacterized protein n=1 Tax=Cohnella faecalis TaxID=2315694 RepID=A0A398D1B6_9BACL|nr:hypothetical protein D3H35_01770 [Cohnella faecalis]
MPALLGIWAAAAAIVMIDLPYIRKNRLVGELWIFTLLLLLGLWLATAKALRWYLPNPMDWIIAFYKPFSDLLSRFGLLQ